jgi:hypothetical protein
MTKRVFRIGVVALAIASLTIVQEGRKILNFFYLLCALFYFADGLVYSMTDPPERT